MATPHVGELARIFLSALPAAIARKAHGVPGLDERLWELLDEARRELSGVSIQTETLLYKLAGAMPREGDVGRALGAIRGADVALAAAVLAGDAEALRLFESQILSKAVRALGLDPVVADEVIQHLRNKLLFSEGKPKLAEYRGRGSLLGWVRVIARRQAIDLAREERRRMPVQELSDDWTAEGLDPELQLVDGEVRAAVREALRSALQKLSQRERALLRLAYVDRLTLERIGTIYQAPKGTVAYWVAQARQRVLELMSVSLAERLKLGHRDVQSLLGQLRGQLDLTISALLK